MKLFTLIIFTMLMSITNFAYSQDNVEKINSIECVGKFNSRIDDSAKPLYAEVILKDYKQTYENEVLYTSRAVIGDPLNLYGNMQGGADKPSVDRKNGSVVYEMFASEELADAPFIDRFKKSVAALTLDTKVLNGRHILYDATLDFIDQEQSAVTDSYEGMLDCLQD